MGAGSSCNVALSINPFLILEVYAQAKAGGRKADETFLLHYQMCIFNPGGVCAGEGGRRESNLISERQTDMSSELPEGCLPSQQVYALEKAGGSIVAGVIKQIQAKRANPPPPRDARLPPKPAGQTVGSFKRGLQSLPRAIAAKNAERIRYFSASTAPIPTNPHYSYRLLLQPLPRAIAAKNAERIRRSESMRLWLLVVTALVSWLGKLGSAGWHEVMGSVPHGSMRQMCTGWSQKKERNHGVQWSLGCQARETPSL